MANFSKSFNFRNGLQVDDDKLIVKPNTGLVGIGNTIPTQVLDVEGNIKSSGTVNTSNVEVGTGITVGINSSISIDGVSGLITAVSYFGDGSTLTNVVAIATAGFKELSGTLSTTSSVGIGSESVGFPDFTLDVVGDVRVTGPSTFIGVTTISDLFANTLSVSNSSSFDDVLVSGVSTFSALTDVNNRLDVVGGANIDQTNVSGVSTFGGAIDANAGADISGGETVLSSATVSDLTDNRIVIAGTSGALEDSGNLTFTGTQFTVTGNAAINGDLQVANGTLDVDGVAGIGSLSVAGVSTFSALTDVNNRLDVVGGANVDQLNVTGVSTLTGRLTATEINSASSNVVRLLQSGTQVFNTIGAGVSVSNTLKIGSLNGGTSGLSALSGLLRYGNESGSAPYSTRRSLDLINNDSGNINFYLNANNLSVPVGGSNFIWHKGFNNDRLMTLTNTGNLGIGETQPNTALHVNGISTVTGNSFVAGNFYGKQNLEIGGDADVVGDLSVTGNFTLNTTLSANVAGNVTGNLSGSINDIGISTFANIAIGTYYPADGIELDGSEIRASFQTVGIGTTNPECGVDFANAGASVGDRFMIPPTVTTTERNGIGETANGGLIFNSTANRLEIFISGGWVGIATTT